MLCRGGGHSATLTVNAPTRHRRRPAAYLAGDSKNRGMIALGRAPSSSFGWLRPPYMPAGVRSYPRQFTVAHQAKPSRRQDVAKAVWEAADVVACELLQLAAFTTAKRYGY
jgi:hypothetical protein